jgi:hypothetical protein
MSDDGSGFGWETWLIFVVLAGGGVFGLLAVLIVGGGVVPVTGHHVGAGEAPSLEPVRVWAGLAGAAGLAAMAGWLNRRRN